LFEGFGIPIIEAQQAGTAVITSRTSSMPEVAGNSAIIVNPKSLEEIAAAMERVFSETEYRKHLIDLGFENCKRFSREKSAKAIWQSMKSIL
jgi:glycosyltransferase involved in cell wall biosynthesis